MSHTDRQTHRQTVMMSVLNVSYRHVTHTQTDKQTVIEVIADCHTQTDRQTVIEVIADCHTQTDRQTVIEVIDDCHTHTHRQTDRQ